MCVALTDRLFPLSSETKAQYKMSISVVGTPFTHLKDFTNLVSDVPFLSVSVYLFV